MISEQNVHDTVSQLFKLRNALTDQGMTQSQQRLICEVPELARDIVLFIRERYPEAHHAVIQMEDDTKLDVHASVEDWSFLYRYRRTLTMEGFTRLGDLTVLSEEEFLHLKGVGGTKLRLLKQALAAHDLSLRPSGVDYWDALKEQYDDIGQASAAHLTRLIESPRSLQRMLLNEYGTIQYAVDTSFKDTQRPRVANFNHFISYDKQQKMLTFAKKVLKVKKTKTK